jgi:hypothetical protein
MKYLITLIICLSLNFKSYSAPEQAVLLKDDNKIEILKRSIIAEMKMTKDKMQAILKQNEIKFKTNNNSIIFNMNQQQMMIIYDENADRMRIICPIIDLEKVTQEQLNLVLEANFHTALDSRYALSDGVLWSVFVHPLSDLSEELFNSALIQTYTAAMTFGSDYSSGYLSFPKNESIKE